MPKGTSARQVRLHLRMELAGRILPVEKGTQKITKNRARTLPPGRLGELQKRLGKPIQVDLLALNRIFRKSAQPIRLAQAVSQSISNRFAGKVGQSQAVHSITDNVAAISRGNDGKPVSLRFELS